MAIRWAEPIYIGSVTVPTPAPLPGPAPTEVLPTEARKTPAGGAAFTLALSTAVSPIYPKLVRAVWLHPEFEETPDPATVLEQPAPFRDIEIEGGGEFVVDPDETVPPGDYKLCLVPGFNEE